MYPPNLPVTATNTTINGQPTIKRKKEFLDILDNPISIGDCIFFDRAIWRVEELKTKMMGCVLVYPAPIGLNTQKNIYAHNCVKLDEWQVAIKCLQP